MAPILLVKCVQFVIDALIVLICVLVVLRFVKVVFFLHPQKRLPPFVQILLLKSLASEVFQLLLLMVALLLIHLVHHVNFFGSHHAVVVLLPNLVFSLFHPHLCQLGVATYFF